MAVIIVSYERETLEVFFYRTKLLRIETIGECLVARAPNFSSSGQNTSVVQAKTQQSELNKSKQKSHISVKCCSLTEDTENTNARIHYI